MYQDSSKDSKIPQGMSAVPMCLLVGVLCLSACSDGGGNSALLVNDGGDDALTETQEPAPLPVLDTRNDKEFEPTADPNEVVPDQTTDSIAYTLLLRSEYSILLGLIERADLADALDDDNAGAGWTLFAPSDVAFENFAPFETMTDDQKGTLVRNHIYSGRLTFAELQPGTLSMTAGSVELVPGPDGLLTIGGANAVARDRAVGNGIIHYVDAVLQAN